MVTFNPLSQGSALRRNSERRDPRDNMASEARAPAGHMSVIRGYHGSSQRRQAADAGSARPPSAAIRREAACALLPYGGRAASPLRAPATSATWTGNDSRARREPWPPGGDRRSHHRRS